MRLAIFGATGATGMQLVAQGLTQRHEIIALVRKSADDRLPSKVVQVEGNALNAESVSGVIEGSDAVVSALGSRSLWQSGLLDRASANIIAGMKRNNVRRLVVLGAAGVTHDAGKYLSPAQRLVLRIVRNTLLKYPFQDQAAQERHLEESDVDYTIVRPPRLTNGPFTGQYRIQSDALPKAAKSTARADVADFMLKQLNDTSFLHRGVYIAR